MLYMVYDLMLSIDVIILFIWLFCSFLLSFFTYALGGNVKNCYLLVVVGWI